MAASLGELGRLEEAQRVASEAIQLATLADNQTIALQASIVRGWAAIRAGKAEAVAELGRLIDVADASTEEYRKVEARLYLADAIAATQPDRAAALCREARAFAVAEENQRLKTLLSRAEATVGNGPLRIGLRGELIIDLSQGWPDYDAAIEAVKRFLVYEAVGQSSGNRSEAARKLNLSRSRLHDIWRQLHGEPPRPKRDEVMTSVS
jgi:DNA-binding NtrC family response regulator